MAMFHYFHYRLKSKKYFPLKIHIKNFKSEKKTVKKSVFRICWFPNLISWFRSSKKVIHLTILLSFSIDCICRVMCSVYTCGICQHITHLPSFQSTNSTGFFTIPHWISLNPYSPNHHIARMKLCYPIPADVDYYFDDFSRTLF